MTWIHWGLFGVLCLFAVATALDKNNPVVARFVTFAVFVAMIVLLLLGQPK